MMIEAAYQEFCAYDSVENAHKLCSLFLGTEDKVVVEAIPKNKKKKVMIIQMHCPSVQRRSGLEKQRKTVPEVIRWNYLFPAIRIGQ